jgi:hypothetical protein
MDKEYLRGMSRGPGQITCFLNLLALKFGPDTVLERAADASKRYSNLETFDVVCLDPLRTFAEKVSLLAQAFDKGQSAIYCRH